MLFAALVTLCTVRATAQAHAVVTKSSLDEMPIVANTAAAVTLHFNSGIEPKLSKVVLVDAAKQERSLAVTPSGTDALTVQVPALTAGKYALRYKVLAVDGHVTEQMLRFEVKSARPD